MNGTSFANTREEGLAAGSAEKKVPEAEACVITTNKRGGA
jgi:hypothetical protein